MESNKTSNDYVINKNEALRDSEAVAQRCSVKKVFL